MADEKKTETKKTETKKTLFSEFRQFLLRGNVLELAVGLTVGTAFTRFVNSLVNNLIMPPIGMLLSGESFRSMYITLNGQAYESLEAAEAADAPIIKYGQFISDSLDLLIIAVVIFMLIKFSNDLYQQFSLENIKPKTTKK